MNTSKSSSALPWKYPVAAMSCLPRAAASPDLSPKPSGIAPDFPSIFRVLINAQEQHDITIVNSSLGITRFQLIGKEPSGGPAVSELRQGETLDSGFAACDSLG
jgi:hypothetical protein